MNESISQSIERAGQNPIVLPGRFCSPLNPVPPTGASSSTFHSLTFLAHTTTKENPKKINKSILFNFQGKHFQPEASYKKWLQYFFIVLLDVFRLALLADGTGRRADWAGPIGPVTGRCRRGRTGVVVPGAGAVGTVAGTARGALLSDEEGNIND